MRLVADENVDSDIISALRAMSFEVTAIADVARGATDEAVLARSVAEAGVLLTADKDFGDLVFRQQLVNQGVLLCTESAIKSGRFFETSIAFLESDNGSGCVLWNAR